MLRQGGARTTGQRGDVIIIPTTRDWVPSPNRYQQPQHKSCWPEKEDRDPTRNLEPPTNTEAELPSTFRRSTSGCECCSKDNPTVDQPISQSANQPPARKKLTDPHHQRWHRDVIRMEQVGCHSDCGRMVSKRGKMIRGGQRGLTYQRAT